MAIQTVLDSELSTALAEREEARSKVADLETVARSLREEKENATMVATERSGAMRQVEVSPVMSKNEQGGIMLTVRRA